MKRKIVYAFVAALFGAVLLTVEQASAVSLMPWSGSQLRFGGNRMPGLDRRFGFDASGGYFDDVRPYHSWRHDPRYRRAFRLPYRPDYRPVYRR